MNAERQVSAMEICGGIGAWGGGVWGFGVLLLTPCEKRCDDEEELQLLKQIESLFLLKELPSSPECWPCGAEKQPSALQRWGPTTSRSELPLQCREIKWICVFACACLGKRGSGMARFEGKWWRCTVSHPGNVRKRLLAFQTNWVIARTL